MASAPSHAAARFGPAGDGGATRARPLWRNNRRELTGEIARYLGAVSILLVGAIHAQQYYEAYLSVVPTIGTLFLLSFIGAGILGTVLFAPVRRLGRRRDVVLLLRRPPSAHQRPRWTFGAESVDETDCVLASVAGEVAVVAVDHRQAGAHVAREVES
jgi:hypothetical protein